jgi:hypothetical protein
MLLRSSRLSSTHCSSHNHSRHTSLFVSILFTQFFFVIASCWYRLHNVHLLIFFTRYQFSPNAHARYARITSYFLVRSSSSPS